MKRISFFLATLFSLTLLLSCGDNEIKKPKDLLKYNVLKDDISDTPIKVQILSYVLIEEKDNIKEDKLKILLNYLYDLRINKIGFQYSNTPNTIAIYAYITEDKAMNGKGQWIAMISKMYDDTKPKFEINKTQFKSLTEKKENKWNLSYLQRIKIWNKIIFAERNAQNDADKKYPLTGLNITNKDIENNIVFGRRQKEKYKNMIVAEYKITSEILKKIGVEGVINGWAFPK